MPDEDQAREIAERHGAAIEEAKVKERTTRIDADEAAAARERTAELEEAVRKRTAEAAAEHEETVKSGRLPAGDITVNIHGDASHVIAELDRLQERFAEVAGEHPVKSRSTPEHLADRLRRQVELVLEAVEARGSEQLTEWEEEANAAAAAADWAAALEHVVATTPAPASPQEPPAPLSTVLAAVWHAVSEEGFGTDVADRVRAVTLGKLQGQT